LIRRYSFTPARHLKKVLALDPKIFVHPRSPPKEDAGS
jgi:hypothetical protein